MDCACISRGNTSRFICEKEKSFSDSFLFNKLGKHITVSLVAGTDFGLDMWIFLLATGKKEAIIFFSYSKEGKG